MTDRPQTPHPTTAGPDAQRGVHIYTDGCFEPLSGDGGWGFVVYRDGIETASGFGGVAHSANNAMELMALLQAARWVHEQAMDMPIALWTDSVYAIRGCHEWRPIWRNNGWKKITANTRARSRTIASADLWQALDLELSRNPSITVAWCKGHAGIDGNERADGLADRGRLSLGDGRGQGRGR